jgi:murein DD-endopeptidase MepM/ murein hydrolase activator NlpD
VRYRYRPYSYERRRRSLFLKLIRRLAILSLLLLSFYAFFLSLGGRPQLEGVESLKFIPAEGEYNLKVKNGKIKSARLYVEQEGKNYKVFEGNFPEGTDSLRISINAKALGIKEGDAKVKLWVSAGFLREREYTIDAKVDLTPPSLEIFSYPKSLKEGSVGVLKVKSNGAEVSLEWDGKKVLMTPVSPEGYVALLPATLGVEGIDLRITAKDQAGNSAQKTLRIAIKRANFKKERIDLTDDFINSVIYPLLGEQAEGLDPVSAFKMVNEEWRKRDVKKLSEITQKSEPVKLWKGAFLRLPNSKVLSTYGVERFYYYKGQQVSQSRHMGYDFASVERAPVPASNDGVVVFVGTLGIYGNVVLIDHGLGLFSLYGHLSEISVKEGQYVKKGDIIGRTGRTGLALGDHLHFGIVVHGQEVDPIYWLDPKWLKNNIDIAFERR